MGTMRRLLGVCAAALSAAIVSACSTDTPKSQSCYPGDFIYGARTADGSTTYEVCGADGAAYEVYDGDPFELPDAGQPDGDAGDGALACDPNAGPLPFMCGGCTTNGQCSNRDTCFQFNMKGAHCTHPCSQGCPPPSGGCGNTGMCKPQ